MRATARDRSNFDPDAPAAAASASGRRRSIAWRDDGLSRLDLFTAELEDYAYPRHMHETYVVALGRQAGYGFDCRGRSHLAWPGALIVINPGDVHDGHNADDGVLRYRSAYPSLELMTRLAADAGSTGVPLFCGCVIDDPSLAAEFEAAHARMQCERGSLNGQTRMLEMLARLIARHSTRACALPRLGQSELAAVMRAKSLLDDRLAENVALDDLAEAAGLSPFHLLRQFRRHIGLPPHAYQMNQRVERARTLLREGVPIAATANRCGFADQAHLTRVFRRYMGATPGAFIAARTFKTA